MSIQCEVILSAVWRFSNNTSNTFMCRKLALNRENLYLLSVDIDPFQLLGMYVEIG